MLTGSVFIDLVLGIKAVKGLIVRQPCCSWKTEFLLHTAQLLILLWFFQSFCLFYQGIPWAFWGAGAIKIDGWAYNSHLFTTVWIREVSNGRQGNKFLECKIASGAQTTIIVHINTGIYETETQKNLIWCSSIQHLIRYFVNSTVRVERMGPHCIPKVLHCWHWWWRWQPESGLRTCSPTQKPTCWKEPKSWRSPRICSALELDSCLQSFQMGLRHLTGRKAPVSHIDLG